VSWSERSDKSSKVVHKQTQNYQEHEEHASTSDMNKCPEKYVCMDQSKQ